MQIYRTPLREFKFLIEDFLKLDDSKVLKKQDLETANQAMSDLRAGKVNGRLVLVPK
mgnify:CR=1 FL=1